MSQNTFHVGIYVKDLPAAVERYKKILGIEPAKVRADYAKFEIADPPVILALSLGGKPGTVHHLGIRYPEVGQVAAELTRTKQQGVEVLEQQSTSCCYAKSDKFWVRDADGMPWEMYTLLGDTEILTDADPAIGALFRKRPAGETQTKDDSCCAPTCCGESVEERKEAVTDLSSVRQSQEQTCCGPMVTSEKISQPQPGSQAGGCCGPTVNVQTDTQPLSAVKNSCC